MRERLRQVLQFDRLAGLYLWLTFVIVFGIWKPELFLTMATVHSVASANAAVAILGLAVLIPLCAGAYDLSAGATMNLATVVVVLLQTSWHMDMVPAIICAVLTGGLIGALNGLVVVKFRVNSFIATLGMSSVVLAFQQMIVGGNQPIPPDSPAWAALTTTPILGFQIVVLYMLVIAFAVWWLLTKTAAGRYIYAIGGNAEAARLAGVPVGRHLYLSFILSGLIAGVGGVLYGSLNGPSLAYGPALLLPAFAAAFLGSVLLRGKFNAWGTVATVYILATGIQGLQFVTSAQWLGGMFNGIVLIVAVAFAMWRQQAIAKSRSRDKTREIRQEERETSGPAGTVDSDEAPG